MTTIVPHVQTGLDVLGELGVVVDELVAGEVESGEGGEPGQQVGGDVVQGVVGEAEEGQVGQHAVILASPSDNERSLIITELCQGDRNCLVIFKLALADALICKRKTQFFISHSKVSPDVANTKSQC